MKNSPIIPMGEVHLSDVERLSTQLNYPNSFDDLKERLRELQALPNHGLLVYFDQKVLGWIHLEEVADLIEEVKVEIKALVVDQDLRGQGIGKALVEHAKQWARARGRKILYLNCNVNRTDAHLFYLKEGMKQVKTSYFFECEV